MAGVSKTIRRTSKTNTTKAPDRSQQKNLKHAKIKTYRIYSTSSPRGLLLTHTDILTHKTIPKHTENNTNAIPHERGGRERSGE